MYGRKRSLAVKAIATKALSLFALLSSELSPNKCRAFSISPTSPPTTARTTSRKYLNREEVPSGIQHLVLVGGGHGHVQVIKSLHRLARPANIRITLIDPQSSTSYSGMVPGCVSNLYAEKQTMIHLNSLAEWAEIEYLQAAVVDFDPIERKIYLDVGGDPVGYDAVSFDIGSTTRGFDQTPGATEHTIPTRPISELVKRITDDENSLISKLRCGQWMGDCRVVVCGGGAAGIELAMAMRARWNPIFAGTDCKLQVTILDSGSELLQTETKPCRDTLKEVLAEREICVKHGATVKSITATKVILTNGEEVPKTHCVWATGGGSLPLAGKLGNRGVAVSDRGWIRVGPTLQSISHPEIFAAGDCNVIENLPGGKTSPPKAGVYAVRSGPILVENLIGYLADGSEADLSQYLPQDDFLKLITCGDGTALGFRFGIPLRGKWVWDLKRRIDTMFMDLFQTESLPTLKEDSKLDKSQYDASGDRGEPMDPEQAAYLLARTDDEVDYEKAWDVLRDMMESEKYKEEVLRFTKITPDIGLDPPVPKGKAIIASCA